MKALIAPATAAACVVVLTLCFGQWSGSPRVELFDPHAAENEPLIHEASRVRRTPRAITRIDHEPLEMIRGSEHAENGSAHGETAVKGSSLGLVTPLFSISSVDEQEGRRLHSLLIKEAGLNQLITEVENNLFYGDAPCVRIGEWRESRDPSGINRLCLSKRILGARDAKEPLSTPFGGEDNVNKIMAEYRRHNERIRIDPSKPSYPLLTGDGFKYTADFYCDTKRNQALNCSWDFSLITNRSLVWVDTADIPQLRAKLARTKAHVFLVSHNRDLPIPGKAGRALLDNPQVLLWFGKNVEINHPKLVPIPIGVENRMYQYGAHPEAYLAQLGAAAVPPKELDRPFVSMNVLNRPTYRERRAALDAAQKWATSSVQKYHGQREYLKALQQHLYVLSPPGNGIESHRTWEALYSGRVPIILETANIGVYDGLPIVRVPKGGWDAVLTEASLRAFRAEAADRQFAFARVWTPWWLLDMLKRCLDVQ